MKKLIVPFVIYFIPFWVHSQTQKRPDVLQEINDIILESNPKSTKSSKSDTTKIIRPNLNQNHLDEIDSIIRNEDEIIEQIFFEEGKQTYPSFVWYRDHFPEQRVKPKEFSLDSLPDEIIITLIKKGESPFCFPVKNVMTSSYGWRWNRAHRGIDIRLKTGDPVHCCFDGVVRIAKKMGNYGNLVVVRHHNGLETVYGHLSKINVEPKQIVKAGEILGLGGSTGRSTGPHLHFEVRLQYEPFDPEWILDFQNYSLRTKKLYLNKSYFGITKPVSENDYLAYKADESMFTDEKNLPGENFREGVYHTVQKGESLTGIASQYKVKKDRLIRINKLESGDVYPGQNIRIF